MKSERQRLITSQSIYCGLFKVRKIRLTSPPFGRICGLKFRGPAEFSNRVSNQSENADTNADRPVGIAPALLGFAPALPTRVRASVENARPLLAPLLRRQATVGFPPSFAAACKKLNFSFFNFCVARAKSNNKLQALKNVSSEIK